MSEISRAVLFGKLDTLLLTSSGKAPMAFCAARNPYVELENTHQLMRRMAIPQVIRHFALDEQQPTRDIVAAGARCPAARSVPFDLSEHIDSAAERLGP